MKPWEAEMQIKHPSRWATCWVWSLYLPRLGIQIDKKFQYFTDPRKAERAARRAMKRMNLVERKAQAGKVK